VHRYRRPLLSYCRRLPLPDGRAEDVIQLALLRAWIAVREGAEVRDLKAWLYRVVHNTALNAARDAAHDSEPVLDDPGSRLHPTAAPPELDLRLRAREALAEVAALPVLQREVMVRTAVAGHSHERVASDLGISDGAVRGLLYRARATVRRAATALTPPPLLSWLAGRMQQAPPTPERLTELAGGGSVGVGGLLFKGGIVAVTASTALTGVAIVHLAGSPHRRSRHQLAVVLPGPAGAGGPTATASAAGTRATSTPAGAGRVGRVSPGRGGARERVRRRAPTSCCDAPPARARAGGRGEPALRRGARCRARAPAVGAGARPRPASRGRRADRAGSSPDRRARPRGAAPRERRPPVKRPRPGRAPARAPRPRAGRGQAGAWAPGRAGARAPRTAAKAGAAAPRAAVAAAKPPARAGNPRAGAKRGPRAARAKARAWSGPCSKRSAASSNTCCTESLL